MTTKVKAPSVATSFGPTPPPTLEERLESIKAMQERIKGYVEFMCEVGRLNGTSAEAKEHAVVVFHEQMVILERRLGRIQEDLRLG